MTNITSEIKKAFDALTSGKYNNFALFSCFVDGEPSATIVAITKEGKEYIIHPLFVAITPGMMLTDHDGNEPKWPEVGTDAKQTCG